MAKCCICEREFEELVEVDGTLVCQQCIEEGDFATCDDCGGLHYYDNMHWTEDGAHICEDCYDCNYYTCDDCGRVMHSDNSTWAYGGDRVICERCRDNNYCYCESCETYYREDEGLYCDEDNCWYCDSCYSNQSDNIYDYHGFNNWHYYDLDNETPPFHIGFELEVENDSNHISNNEMAGWVTDNYNAICSKDGSLNNGFEIVSHPQSYNYIVENQDKLKEMLDNLRKQGFLSHNVDTCGLHFHVSHPNNEDIIDRIILVMETYKEEMIKFSRRTQSQIENWCKFLSDYRGDSPEEVKSLYYIKKNKETSTRYMALNLSNYKTIEFRLFRGTLNFDTFMATVELVNNIMTLCSNLEIPIEEITWDRLTETQYAHTYCDMKNIRSTIIPKSNDEKYLEREKKEKQCRENIVKIIEEEMRPLIQHNMIPNEVLSASNIMELDEKIYNYARTLGSLRDFINIMKTIVYGCENDTSITAVNEKINTSRIYIPYLDCYDDIVKVIEKLQKEIKNVLGKESE